jgi:hypothetical protein
VEPLCFLPVALRREQTEANYAFMLFALTRSFLMRFGGRQRLKTSDHAVWRAVNSRSGGCVRHGRLVVMLLVWTQAGCFNDLLFPGREDHPGPAAIP